jgi:hypothetical protein
MERRPPYWAAILAGTVVFILYLVTLAPTTAFWDASEYIATAHIFGIPHPPGNPLFVVLARVFSVLLSPLGLPVAVRINVFAAATSAAAASFMFLIAHRLVSSFVTERWMGLAGAACAALLSATAFTVWNQSTVNEKVYTVSVLVIAAASWLMVLWYDNRARPKSLRYLLATLYMVVLGSTNHLMSVLPAPALGLLVLLAGLGFLAQGGFWLRAVPLVLVGLSFNLVLPVRSAIDPVINEGEPTCESVSGAFAAVWTNGKVGCPALAANLRRDQYGKPPVTQRMAPVGAQVANYFQYFDWQWSRGVDASEVPGNARIPFTLVFFVLGAAGLYATLRADRILFVYFAGLAGVLTLGLVFYLNFKYGFSLAPEVTDPNLHEVRERDYFFVAGFALWGMLAGVGLTWAWSTVVASLASARASLATAPLLLVAVIPLALNWEWASRAGDWAARDWAYDLLMSVEPYAVLFTNGDNDTFPLWYLQEVEGVRKDVTVIVGQYLHTLWYPRQLQRLTMPARQRPYRAPAGVTLYADPGLPDSAIISVDPALMDRVVGGQITQELTVPFPVLTVAYPAGTNLDRSLRLALAIIRDSTAKRPIYFATASGMMADLGLEQWGVRHGLATKLVLQPVEVLDGLGFTQVPVELGGERFDVARSLALYDQVYSYRGLLDRSLWTDRSTLNIPWQFYALALQLADAIERSEGSPEVAKRLRLDAANFQVTSAGGSRGS